MTHIESAIVVWRPARSPGALASATNDLLTAVSGVDSTMKRWFIPDGTPRRGEPLRGGNAMDLLMAAGTAGPPLVGNPDAFILRLWNGEDGDRGSGIFVRDGFHLPSKTPAGTAGLDLPRSIGNEARVGVLRALAETFRPDMGALTNTELIGRLDEGKSAGPVIYISESQYELHSLPPWVVEEPSAAPGHILRYRAWTGVDFSSEELQVLDTAFTARESASANSGLTGGG